MDHLNTVIRVHTIKKTEDDNKIEWTVKLVADFIEAEVLTNITLTIKLDADPESHFPLPVGKEFNLSMLPANRELREFDTRNVTMEFLTPEDAPDITEGDPDEDTSGEEEPREETKKDPPKSQPKPRAHKKPKKCPECGGGAIEQSPGGIYWRCPCGWQTTTGKTMRG